MKHTVLYESPRLKIEESVATLQRTKRGERAMGALNLFLEFGGLGLDPINQQAVLDLLDAAYDGHAGTVDDFTRAYRAQTGNQS